MRYLVVLMLLTGCVKEGGWVKNGASDQEFHADRGACVAQAYSAPNPQSRAIVLAGCMQGKGWHWEEK